MTYKKESCFCAPAPASVADKDPQSACIRIKLKGRIRIRIKVISWIRIRKRINLQMASQNVWNMSLFEHFFKVLSLYWKDPDPHQRERQDPIRILITVTNRSGSAILPHPFLCKQSQPEHTDSWEGHLPILKILKHYHVRILIGQLLLQRTWSEALSEHIQVVRCSWITGLALN